MRNVLFISSSLLLMIGAIVLVGWLYSHIRRTQIYNGKVIRVLATQPLGPKERVVLVEVAGKQLVLGMTAGHIQTLHVLEQPLESDGQVPPPSGFAERLRIAIMGVPK